MSAKAQPAGKDSDGTPARAANSHSSEAQGLDITDVTFEATDISAELVISCIVSNPNTFVLLLWLCPAECHKKYSERHQSSEEATARSMQHDEPKIGDSKLRLPTHRSRIIVSDMASSSLPAQPRVIEEVTEQPFAGRLGGGQRFTLSSSATSTGSDNVKLPDATRNPSWSSLLSFAAFYDLRLWKLAFIEAIGTGLQTYLSGLLGHGLAPTVSETAVGAVFPVALASLAQVFIISLFVWSTGPVTGAHFNPLITIATFCTKLSSLPRTVLYVVFQCLGAVVGAYLCRGALGVGPEELAVLPGCYIDPSLVSPGEAYILETTLAFTQIFLAFGLGLDPRNSTSFGPGLAPLLIGLSSALCIFFSGFARKGYLGASNNPARCLGLMAAADRFDYHYIHWTGDITAAIVNGILYSLVPPYKEV